MRLSLLAFACVLFVAVPVHAQDDADVARARQLFQSGLDAARGQHWADARDAFSQSLDLAERPSTLLNLAGAQIQTGLLVEGAASYRRFLELATSGREAAHRPEAESALALVTPRISHATIQIEGLTSRDEVRLDGNILLPAMIGTSVALNPGAHDVTVARAGRSISSQRFQLAEGASVEIALSLGASVDPALATQPMDDALAMPVSDQHGDDTGIWIAVGVSIGVAVVIGVVVAIVFATQSSAPTPYQGNFGDGVVHF